MFFPNLKKMSSNPTPKSIVRPQLKGARELSAAELNKVRLSDKRTLLTPERLERMAAAGTQDTQE